MKIAVIGCGAVGGYLAIRLALAGEDVTVVARGPNLDAIRAHGMTLILEDGTREHTRRLRAVESLAEAGAQDVVFLTVKAHQVAAVAGDVHRLCNAKTTLVTMQNGIPWWYFYKHGGEFVGHSVRSVDPDGSIARQIDPELVVGSVVYPAAILTAPGVVQLVEGNRFTLGEPDGSASPRVQAIATVLEKAGFRAPVTNDIRGEIWVKLWGNMSFNPISALTHATLADICRFALTRGLVTQMMREAQTIAGKLGVTFRVSIERRIAGAEKVGAHKTSMLQDVEQGRSIELEALLGSVVELGALTRTPTPHIDAVYACATLLARTLSAHQARLQIAR